MAFKVDTYRRWSDGEEVRDFGKVLIVEHNGKILFEEADTMEPEDACFGRDLSWVQDAIMKAYTCGLEDATLEFTAEKRN